MKRFLPLLIILPLSFWLSCEDDTSAEGTYSINGTWERENISAGTYTCIRIKNEEVFMEITLMRQFSDTCYALSYYTDRQLMQTDSLQFLYPHDYMLTTIDSLSDNPLTWYQYYNLSKDTLWYKSYLCYWDSDECIPDDDWFYERYDHEEDGQLSWGPVCNW